MVDVYYYIDIRGVSRELTKSISFVLESGAIPGTKMGGKQFFKHIHFDVIDWCEVHTVNF